VTRAHPIQQLIRSPALRVTLGHGLGGLGWAVSNLLLARALTPTDYAHFALVLALVQLGGALGPLGVDLVAKRRRLSPSLALLLQVGASCLIVGVGMAGLGAALYGLNLGLLAALIGGAVAGGLVGVAAAEYQGRQRFGRSLGLAQIQSVILLFAAAAGLVLRSPTALAPSLVYASLYAGAAAVAWTVLLRDRGRESVPGERFAWPEAFALLALQSAGLLLVQLDRLLIPRVLTVAELATFSVLAAIVGSPLRMLHLGVGYTLLPRLRAANGVEERHRLLIREAVLVGIVAALTSVAAWFLTPVAVRWFLHGKYDLPGALILAGIVTGLIKVVEAFMTAAATALADTRELARLSAFGWTAVLVAGVAGVLGARWGLVGLVYGVGVGWAARTVFAAALAAPYLRRTSSRTPAPAPAPAPPPR
jgi:O-antigen/teichoic acid export membrane protein